MLQNIPACCKSPKNTFPVNSLTSLALVNHKNHLMGIKPSLHFTSPVLHVQSVLIPNTCKTWQSHP